MLERIKNKSVLQLYTATYKKFNDRHKHKTAYRQRVQYLDESYRFSLLLKLITLSHEIHSFVKPFQADTERLQKIFMHTLLLNNFLVIFKLWPRVFELLRTKKSCSSKSTSLWKIL